MRALYLVLAAGLLSACCRFSGPVGEPQDTTPVEASAVSSPAHAASDEPTVKPPVVMESPPVPPVEEAAESYGEGAIVCRKDGDVRIVEIHMLEDGRCMLVYDNRLSGNGTQNALASRVACETQQQRMKQNFLHSGFVCR